VDLRLEILSSLPGRKVFFLDWGSFWFLRGPYCEFSHWGIVGGVSGGLLQGGSF